MARSEEKSPIAPEEERPTGAESMASESGASDSDANGAPSLDELRSDVEAALGRVEAREAATRKSVAELNAHLKPLREKASALKPIRELSSPAIAAMIETASAEFRKVREAIDRIAGQLEYDFELRCALCDAIEHQWQRYWAQTGGGLDDWSAAIEGPVATAREEIQAATEAVIARERRWLD